VCVIVRALEVCTELNLSAGIDYHESLVQLSVLESDRAKYSNSVFTVCDFEQLLQIVFTAFLCISFRSVVILV